MKTEKGEVHVNAPVNMECQSYQRGPVNLDVQGKVKIEL